MAEDDERGARVAHIVAFGSTRVYYFHEYGSGNCRCHFGGLGMAFM
jgi:hypothetical protein